MTPPNRPVTSREYKLMLAVDRFHPTDQGLKAFWSLIKFLVQKEKGEVEDQGDEEERRRTWYVDTAGLALHRHGYALRLREEGEEVKKYQVTLKCRASDRYLSASQDLSSSKKSKFKFEEDIIPPFVSRFSHSTSLKLKELPNFSTMGDAVELFPGLKNLDIADESRLGTVNNFCAHEVAHKIGKIKFGAPTKVKACLSFWYLLGTRGERPLAGEFSFDYDAPKRKPADQDKVERFPTAVVAGTNQFFKTLQKQAGWIDVNSTTKTAFAYEGL